MTNEERQPIEDVLSGFTLHPLEEGSSPLQAFVLIKSLDVAAEASWSFRTSEQLNLEELLGALIVQVELLKKKLVHQWDDEDEED